MKLLVVVFFKIGWHCFNDLLLLRIDGKLRLLINCVLASVLRRSLWTGLNNLYLAVSKMVAVTRYSTDS